MRHPLERLMRDHPRGTDLHTSQALAILLKETPADLFSMMQWSVGLPYYEQRLLDWKLSGDACLDFGCGTGNWTLAASRFFGHVVGVDTHHQRLRSAIMIRDALDVRNVIFESYFNAPSAEASLDCILLYNVLPTRQPGRDDSAIDRFPEAHRATRRLIQRDRHLSLLSFQRDPLSSATLCEESVRCACVWFHQSIPAGAIAFRIDTWLSSNCCSSFVLSQNRLRSLVEELGHRSTRLGITAIPAQNFLRAVFSRDGAAKTMTDL